MMKFALIRPLEFQAIYFETKELAKTAQASINELSGKDMKTYIIRVANTSLPFPLTREAEDEEEEKNCLTDENLLNLSNSPMNEFKNELRKENAKKKSKSRS